MKIRTVTAICGLAAVIAAPHAGAQTGLGLSATPTEGYGSLDVHYTSERGCTDDQGLPVAGHIGVYEELPNVLLTWQDAPGAVDDYFHFSSPGIYSIQMFCSATNSAPAYNERVKVHVYEAPTTTTRPA